LRIAEDALEAAESGVEFVVSLLFFEEEIGLGARVGKEIIRKSDHIGELNAEVLPGGGGGKISEAGDGDIKGAGELGPFWFLSDNGEEGRFGLECGVRGAGDEEGACFGEMMIGEGGGEAGGGLFVVAGGEEDSAGGEAELRGFEDTIAECADHADGVGEVVLLEKDVGHGEADLIELSGWEEVGINAQLEIAVGESESGGIVGGEESIADTIEEGVGVVGGEEVYGRGIEFDGA